MSEPEECRHDWILEETYCETCGGHDLLYCRSCNEVIDQYARYDSDRWASVITLGTWRHG